MLRTGKLVIMLAFSHSADEVLVDIEARDDKAVEPTSSTRRLTAMAMGKRWRVAAIVTVAGVAVTWFGLVVTDSRILVEERLVQPGQAYVVEGHGDLGENSQASLVCRYFNGRRVLSTVFWYAPNNFMGRDSCPFISRDQ